MQLTSLKDAGSSKNTCKRESMKVELEKAQSHKLPYDGNFFGSVICFAVLHCIETPEKRKRTLEEIYRVLKTGGEALISSWGRKSQGFAQRKKNVSFPGQQGR
jgi:ubiquinone/menaquinone biosynthesis C-methylase UbiE